MRAGIRLLVASPLLIALQNHVQASPRDLPLASRLQRGINLTGWFVGSSPTPAEKRFSDSDLRVISGLGFTFVRLPVNPARLMLGRALNQDSLGALVRAIDLITTSGLAVIVDFHPDQDFERNVVSDKDSLHAFLGLLDAVCSHLRTRSTTDLGVELLNEPFDPGVGGKGWDWNVIQRELWKVARQALPEHTLVLTGDAWSSISGLSTVIPVPDPNVLYTIHFYQPYPFTHQGANWMASDPQHFADLRGVPYPGDSLRVSTALGPIIEHASRAELRDSIRGELLAYGRAHWNRDKLAHSFSQAAGWASQNRKQLVLGEFGVYKRGADPADRCRWVRDVRELAEANHFSWAMWEYDGGFGLLNEDHTANKCLTGALGLTPVESR